MTTRFFCFPFSLVLPLVTLTVLSAPLGAQLVGGDWRQAHQKSGAAAADSFGLSADWAGDLNGDGRPDFLVGAPYASPGGRSAWARICSSSRQV